MSSKKENKTLDGDIATGKAADHLHNCSSTSCEDIKRSGRRIRFTFGSETNLIKSSLPMTNANNKNSKSYISSLTASSMMETVNTSSPNRINSTTNDREWSAEEEETLMISALQELENADIEKEAYGKEKEMKIVDQQQQQKQRGYQNKAKAAVACSELLDLNYISDNGGGSSSSSSEEDFDIIDWEYISKSLINRSPVECLKKYLKLSRTQHKHRTKRRKYL